MKRIIVTVLLTLTSSLVLANQKPLTMVCNIDDQAVALYSFSYTKTGSLGRLDLFVKSEGRFSHHSGETTESLLNAEISITTSEGTFTVGPDMKHGVCLIDVK